jgi:hypothetical protein
MKDTQNNRNQELSRINPNTQESTNMDSNRNNQMSSRIVGGRMFLVLALLGLLLGTATQANAMGGIITTGRVVFGQTGHTYAVVFDPASPRGYYIRVWLDGFRIMQLWAGEMRNGTFMMNYHVYNTMGQHWTLRGGVDRTRSWLAQSAGELAMDPRTIPANTMGIVSGYMSGRGRKTYRAHNGASRRWFPVREGWWNVQFYPGNVNQQLFTQWQQWLQASRRPKCPKTPKKPLTNVTVNRHQVIVKMWDHAKQDGDIVDLYLNGKYLRRISLTKGGSSLTLNLATGNHRFEVRALNEGTDKPNTASISITGVVKGNPRQSWSLKTGQVTGMYITVTPR